MEHNTDRILWTVLILAIGVALYVGFRPATNGLLHQVIDKTQTVVTNVHGDTSDSSSTNPSSSSNSHPTVNPNLLVKTSDGEVSGKTYWFATYQIAGGLQPETTYTLSGRARVDQKAIDNQQHVFVCAYATDGKTSDWSWAGWLHIDPSLTKKYNKITFTTPSGNYHFNPYVIVYLSGPKSQDEISGTGYISKLKLEKGSVATPYTP